MSPFLSLDNIYAWGQRRLQGARENVADAANFASDVVDEVVFVSDFAVHNPGTTALAGVKGVASGGNEMFIQPAVHTAQFIYDVPHAFNPDYDPYNETLRDYLKGDRSTIGAVFSITTDGLATVPVFKGVKGTVEAGTSAVRRFTSLSKSGAAVAEIEVLAQSALVEAGITRLPQTGSGTFIGAADEAYNAIRKSKADVEAIANNTGFKPENIQKIKEHVFNQEHLLDKYVELGVPGKMARFDSDIGIANAWNRLERGTHTASDLQLLRHEAAEAFLMRFWKDPSYIRAHTRAQQRFPAPRLED